MRQAFRLKKCVRSTGFYSVLSQDIPSWLPIHRPALDNLKNVRGSTRKNAVVRPCPAFDLKNLQVELAKRNVSFLDSLQICEDVAYQIGSLAEEGLISSHVKIYPLISCHVKLNLYEIFLIVNKWEGYPISVPLKD